ncbi:glycosyltransferase [Pontiella sp.]|uniref:glycosyltransferase n=1 Tax=Pontiella sp. TaxID=2837462 RepID=UPI003569F1FE
MNIISDKVEGVGPCKVTVIVPLRVAEDRQDAFHRLTFIEEDGERPEGVRILIVDDGSPQAMSNKLKAFCRERDYGYMRLETELQEFSVGRCRNYGAMYSNSTYVFMQDVDLVPYTGFYQQLLDEIAVQELDGDIKRFLMIPYIFMTEEGSQEFFEIPAELRVRRFLQFLLEGDCSRIEKFSTGTSANLYNRMWYLSRGGNSSDFEGWGFEDLECNTRMLRHLNLFPTPREWQLQKYNFNTVTEYRSWKASYRLFGDMMFFKGTVLFHYWHPSGGDGGYSARKAQNEKLFAKKMKEFVAERKEPEPLPDMHAGTTLLMRSNPFTFARDIQPMLGRIVEPSVQLFDEPWTLKSFMQEHAVDRIMFFNPYADERMQGVYVEARKIGVPFFVAERGSLPGSVFFDPKGFLLDSSSYDVEVWDKPLSDEKRKATLEYIRQERTHDQTLESQSQRIGGSALRSRYGIKRWQKILYVSLQRPSDTVTNHFCGEIGSYGNFMKLVEEVSGKLPNNWVMAIKQHPLEEDDMSRFNSVDFGRSHIKDILDVADCVLTFNSGVGVLSMAWEKPTLLAGAAFYADDRINRQVLTVDDVVRNLKDLYTPDQETMLRFYSYLVNDFYSFARFTTRQDKLPCGANITSTRAIDYDVIRGLREQELRLSRYEKAPLGWNSILFDRYRFAENHAPSARKVSAPTEGVLKPQATMSPKPTNQSSSLIRKTRKLIKTPRRFFADARFYSRFFA